jgi:hypothetical protein
MDDISSYVYVNSATGAVRRDVSAGIDDTNFVEIKSGLKEGDAVLLSGSDSKVTR